MPDIRKVDGLIFECESQIEAWRVETLLTKEEGTIRWLQRRCEPGSVVWDIGANIGLYTLYAAKRGAVVFAFEPHAANTANLLRNIAHNGFNDVTVVASPLHSTPGSAVFYYRSLESGSSGSQLGHDGVQVARQLVEATTLDRLYEAGLIQAPTLVKIDVDGNEFEILKGMEHVLSQAPPWSLQVEINADTAQEIREYLRTYGFEMVERHDTMFGAAQLKKGTPAEQVVHNEIFERRA